MGKKNRVCVICGVKERHRNGFFANFPLDKRRCKEWVCVIGNQDYAYLPIEKLHRGRFVCGDHFTKKDFNKKGNRLRKKAIPSLKLTASPLTEDQLEGFPYHVASWYTREILPKKRRCQPSDSDLNSEMKRKKILEGIEHTPRKQKLVAQLQRTKCTLSSLRRSAKLLESLSSPVLKELVAADLKNKNRNPKGRRWTLKEKVSALAIFKRSPKTYRYLENGLMLPSIKTLHNLLRKIPMDTGVNIAVLQHLQKISPTMEVNNKICVILFDEIALKPRLVYNEGTDQVDGYEDKGKNVHSGRCNKIADHALVFMIQGLHARYKQLVAYYFIKGTVSSQQLAAYVNELIKAIDDAGFRVMATVCDQGPTNMGAMKLLKEHSNANFIDFTSPIERRNFFYTANGKKIYIMYDIPHLFKSIRNNFMNHGRLQIGDNCGKWPYLYEVEEKNKSLLHLSKITSAHVRPKYRAKMKVKYAAQALSNTVSAVLKLMSQAESVEQRKSDLMQTALVVEYLDRLFDCCNGPSCKEDVKKGQRQNVSAKTNHIELWNNYRKTMPGLKFLKNDNTEAKNVKCIQGFLISLKTLRDVWQDVQNLGFQYLNLRSLNQDGLENFFGIIRQHSPTNRNPTCSGFVAALKTSVVTGMSAPHSKGSNCEKDKHTLLTNFEDILLEADATYAYTQTAASMNSSSNVETYQDTSFVLDEADEHPVISIPEELDNEIDLCDAKFQPLVYVSGYLASTFKTHSCAKCRNLLVEEDEQKQRSAIYHYIQLREWWDDQHSLTYPSVMLCHMLEISVSIFEKEMLSRLHEPNISAMCTTLFMTSCDTTWFTCSHANSILVAIFGRLGRLLIRRQCHRINQNFAECEERVKDISKRAEQGCN